MIESLADNKTIFYTNAGGNELLNSDGTIKTTLYDSDHVHPNAQGFELIDQVLAPIVRELEEG